MLPYVVMECRAVADADLRYAQTGTAVASVRTVCSSRKKGDDGKWVDDRTVWLTVKCFKAMAEHVAESVRKGDLLTVQGRLQQDEWNDRETGEKRTGFSVLADNVGLALNFRAASAVRTERQQAPAQEDPWATSLPESDVQAPKQRDDPPF